MSLRSFRNEAHARQHKPLCPTPCWALDAAKQQQETSFLESRAERTLHKATGRAKCPGLNHYCTHIWICLNFQVWIWIHLAGSLYSVAQGKDAQAVPVGGSPERPGGVCTEDLEVGSGSVSMAGLVIASHTPSSVFGVAKLKRLWKEKLQSLTEFESPQKRGWLGCWLISVILVFCLFHCLLRVCLRFTVLIAPLGVLPSFKEAQASAELQLSPPGSLSAAARGFLRWVGICPRPVHCVPEFPVHCL